MSLIKKIMKAYIGFAMIMSLIAPINVKGESNVSRDVLNERIQEANAIDEDLYSDESYKTLDEKLVIAETLALDASQNEVDQVALELYEAMNNLKPRDNMNLALNKNVSVSGLEVSDGRFSEDKAVDGMVSTESRVSFAKDKDEQWMIIDLEEVKMVSYFVINYESQAPSFKIQVSVDGETYNDVYEVSGLEGQVSAVQHINIQPTEARYVKYVQLERWLHNTLNRYYSGSIYEFEVYERGTDLINYANLALHKDVRVSGLEVTDGRFSEDKAVDGMVSTESRVSFAKDKDEQWMIIDLGGRKTVSSFVINYESQAPSFKVQVSTDGETYSDVYEVSGLEGQVSNIQEISIEPTKARYIKYVQLERWLHSGNGKYYSGSIYEFEVYKAKRVEEQTASEVLASLNNEKPTISDDKIILPEVPEGFEIKLYGSDNQQVITMEGNIIQPLEDMDVNLLYEVRNINDRDDVAYSESDINIIVAGKYSSEESMHAKPQVLPGLREWKGNEGYFTLNSQSRIVVENQSLSKTAKQIQFYFKEMLQLEIPIVEADAKSGDIMLVSDASLAELGKEGYLLEIDDIITIKANDPIGILYGGISITQILYQDEGKDNVPKGIARDYPKYEVRSGMLDVGRTYIPMDYLREMTIYMAYFKLNEIQVHINDYWGATGYSAFRLESETYPMITATDGSYTKDEYRQYQIDMKEYGIDVVSEIDTPYHSECFRNIPGAEMLKTGALDIRKESSYTIIENLLDEYLDGNDPVIQSNKFHIGTDEYDKAYSEDMRKWTDHFIRYVNEKGYETRLWASLGSKGFNGTTPVSNEATVNLWAPYWADVKETYAAGYDIINTCGGWLYIVPAANAGYPDRLDIQSLYDKFDVNNFAPSRNYGNGTAIMPMAHPQTKGAEFCVWNDMTSFNGGFSWFDIFDRFKDAVMLVSEKTWYGEKTAQQTASQFMERVDALNDMVPGANPARYVKSENEVVSSYDFEAIDGQYVKDGSLNHYDATLVNGQITNSMTAQAIHFTGNGYLSLPYQSIGYPYTVMMNLYLSSNTAEDSEIFSGTDGVLYANINGTNKLGYARGSYVFTFDYELPKDEWVHISLTCNQKDTTLYINGEKIAVGKNTAQAINNRNDSTTFILPVEKIMNKATGSIDNLTIYNKVLSESEINQGLGIEELENIAFNKPVYASSTYPNKPWTAEKVTDGITSGDSRWSSKRATGDASNDSDGEYGSIEQTLMIDLEEEYDIDKINVMWEAAYATKYTIEGSLDGESFFEIQNVTNGEGGNVTFNELNTKTRYIRIVMHEATNAKWGYSIYEVEVYQSHLQRLQDTLASLMELYDGIDKGETNGTMLENDYDHYTQLIENASMLIQKENASNYEFNSMYLLIKEGINQFHDKIIFEKETTMTLYQQMKDYEEKDFTRDSYQGFDEKMVEIKSLIESASDHKQVSDVYQQLMELNSSLIRLNRNPLKDLIAECEEMDENQYTATSYQVMKQLLEEAIVLYENPSVNQEELDQKEVQLRNAKNALVEKDVLDAVQNVAAAPSDYKTIILTWDIVQNATAYVVERLDTNTSNWIVLAQTNEPTYVVSGVKTGKEYTYRVKAIQQNDAQVIESEYSEEVSATTSLNGEIELSITANGTRKFDLSWNTIDGATRYIIYRQSGDGEWKKILTLGKDATTYTSNAMLAGIYAYQVKAARYDSLDRVMSEGSNIVEGIVEAASLKPANVTVEAQGTTATLTWSKVEGMKGYEIYRSKDQGAFRHVKTTTSTTLTNSSLKAGSTYTYKVRAYTIVNGTKVYSSEVESEPVTLP